MCSRTLVAVTAVRIAAAIAAAAIALTTVTGCTTPPAGGHGHTPTASAAPPAASTPAQPPTAARTRPPATPDGATRADSSAPTRVSPTGPGTGGPDSVAAASTEAAGGGAVPSGPAGPLQVAAEWLAAYRAASWDRPATGWIDAVAPYVTARLNQENRQLSGAGGGAGWAEFVARRCTTTITGAGAVIPPEAPATDALVHVQVAGTLHTTCRTGPTVPDGPAAVTLTVIATPLGWRVDAREQ